MAVSAAQVKALTLIAESNVFAHVKGYNDTEAPERITRQTFAALLKAGMVTFNGAARKTLTDGRSARKALLTDAGLAALPV